MTKAQWAAVSAAALVGTLAGLGAFTFVYARGASYLGHDPAACANCHIMSEHYSAWLKSSHRAAAGCNDCHTPHDFVRKYAVKASNGFWHSFAFTTGRFPDPLRIKRGNLRVTEEACRHCHEAVTEAIDHGGEPREGAARALAGEAVLCTRCHDDVGHWTRD